MPSETYVLDILKGILAEKTKLFNELSGKLNGLSSLSIEPMSEELYFTLSVDREEMARRRRETRGEMSALRQAIRVLEEDMKNVQNNL